MKFMIRRFALGAGLAVALAAPAFAQAGLDLTGNYLVTGQNGGEQGTYAADVAVTLEGDVYHLAWDAQGQKVDGVGLRLGDTLAVTWQDPATREAAVAVYIMMPDGGLKGRWAPIGAKTAGTEEWTRKP